jgi:hypothetical protein
MRNRFLVALVALAAGALVLAPRQAIGQTTTSGAIAGVVKDTTGAVLPGVTVEAASAALIEKVRSVVSDAQGNYKIIDLRPGTYTVTFTLPGFSVVKREGIELSAGFTANINGELKVGSLEETVTVTGESPIVDIQNVRTAKVLSRDVLDTLPADRSLVGLAALTLGVTAGGTAGNGSAVGGSKGEGHDTTMQIHGSRAGDMETRVDGMNINASNGIGGAFRHEALNQAAIQETVVETDGSTAQSDSAGVITNSVPREGGNTLTFYSQGLYTKGALQASNLTADLQGRGLSATPSLKNAFDIGVGVGGKLVQDKVWFYAAARDWGGTEYIPGNYYNASPNPLFYVPDLTRPADRTRYYRDVQGRITWKLADKQKLNVQTGYQRSCNCHRGVELAANALRPDAAVDVHFGPIALTMVTWQYTATSKLLIEAGTSYLYDLETLQPSSPASYTNISVLELSNGYRYGSAFLQGGTLDYTGSGAPLKGSHFDTRASVSYVTGAHAFKAGFTTISGAATNGGDTNSSVGYVFNNGVPVQLQEFATPNFGQMNLKMLLGAYGQDQWTIHRVTLNVGLRYDYLNEYVPAQTRPGGQLLPALQVAEIDNVPNWKDINPRVGAAYDLFGNGKTAVKGSFGRYVQVESIQTAQANNPALTLVTSATRNWTDTNHNFVPDCVITNPLANGECGALSNLAFGTVAPNSVYDPSLLTGWGVRPATWQATVSAQQQVGSRIGVTIGYFRTWYENFRVTTNTAVGPTDFTSFCYTVPVDARLPGGGGNQVCGNYDPTPASFGLTKNVIYPASKYGTQTEVFNGVDASLTARFLKSGLLSGGVSTGQTVTDICYLNNLPNVTPTTYINGAALAAGTPRNQDFCHVAMPWSSATQVKLSGSYPLPRGMQISAVYQNLPGVANSASFVVTNAQVVPTLGRNLGSCKGAPTCSATTSLNLTAPNALFDSRFQQFDIRLTKILRLGHYQMKGNVDLYNVFNGATATTSNTRYGSSWLLPSVVQAARLVEFSGQFEF